MYGTLEEFLENWKGDLYQMGGKSTGRENGNNESLLVPYPWTGSHVPHYHLIGFRLSEIWHLPANFSPNPFHPPQHMIYQTVFALCAPDAIMQSYHVYQLLCYKHHNMTPGHLISCNVNLLLRTRGIMGEGSRRFLFNKLRIFKELHLLNFLIS